MDLASDYRGPYARFRSIVVSIDSMHLTHAAEQDLRLDCAQNVIEKRDEYSLLSFNEKGNGEMGRGYK